MQQNKEVYNYDRQFQERIVSLILREPTFLKDYGDIISPVYFEYDSLVIVSRLVITYFEENSETPSRDIVRELLREYFVAYQASNAIQNDISELLDRVYNLSIDNISYVKEKVVKFGRRQALKGALHKIAYMVGNDEDYDKAEEIVSDALLVGMGTSDLGFHLQEGLLDLPSLIKKSSYSEGNKIKTGWPTFDKNTSGGLARKEVWVVGARSGAGKSTVLVQLGMACLVAGHSVVHYTIGDLNDVDVGIRYASRITGCTIGQIVRNDPLFRDRAAKRAKHNNDLWIKYYPSGQASMANIRAHMSKLSSVKGVKPGMIIIDYPDELFHEDMYKDIGKIYSDIQAMGHDYNAVMLAASQVKNEGRRDQSLAMGMEDLDHSKLKYTKCDGMFSVNQTTQERKEGKMRIWVDKTRRYKSHYLIDMSIDYSISKVCELPHQKEEV